MIDVKLLAWTNKDPLVTASDAGKWCYQAQPPEVDQPLIPVKNALFETGHHTTLQHWHATFGIDGISVGDVTFGLHLCSPFYDSDQRSGRFCGEMFANPDFKQIEEYIRAFNCVYPRELEQAMAYIKDGIEIYQKNLDKAVALAKELIVQERPKATQEYVNSNGPKIAQEQLRVFIPLIFPTGLTHTVNLSALAASYRAAWNPVLRNVYGKMAAAVVQLFPEVDFMFDGFQNIDDWAVPIKKDFDGSTIKTSPWLALRRLDALKIFPDRGMLHPVDMLHFHPESLPAADCGVETQIETSAATMGQDQRHRTIRRGLPVFTRSFYMPPIIKELRLHQEAQDSIASWAILEGRIPPVVHRILAPYGAMLAYNKCGSFNAVIHEQAKRLCWCAQEEVYNLSRLLREAVEKECPEHLLLQCMDPHCYRTDHCAEGRRYCGRDICDKNGYFRPRMV